MNALKYEFYRGRLQRRRGEVLKTLQYVREEQRAVIENQESIDVAAFKSRCALLDGLAEWYAAESAQIDEALLRMRDATYGICLGCRKPIAAQRLEAAPEAAFCAECQALREGLQQARAN